MHLLLNAMVQLLHSSLFLSKVQLLAFGTTVVAIASLSLVLLLSLLLQPRLLLHIP